MRDPDRLVACRNCDREYPAHRLDRLRWCDLCRRAVVRRATGVARVIGTMAALGLVAWIWLVVQPGSRLLVVWAVLVAAVYFFTYKLTQRVAFEIIRARGVRR